MDIGKLLELNGKLDRETVMLFGRFIVRALKEPDTNKWVKAQLQAILDPPAAPGPIHVEVRTCSNPTAPTRRK